MPHLTKSDFKVARDCPAKLYYKKLRYPSLKDEDEFLALLADGGYMVEGIAKLLHPDGIAMSYEGANVEAAEATRRALEAASVTLFEATLLAGAKLARADILVKRGDRFDLIEVKAKSYDSSVPGVRLPDGTFVLPTGRTGAPAAEWDEYLDDVCYQAHVLRLLYPKAEIHPYLLMPDKAKTTGIDEVHRFFDLRRETDARGYEHVSVAFTGTDADRERIRGDHFLTLVDVSREELARRAEIAAAADRFAASVSPEVVPLAGTLSTKCASCEYRAEGEDGRCGFDECWGALAEPVPHLLELYHVGSRPMADYAAQLIAEGRAGMYDVDLRRLTRADGTVGGYGKRQRTQIEHTRAGTEWASEGLASALAAHAHPLHFIDFEASALAVPYHAGMRPYEPVVFQWSCHTIAEPGAEPVHREWINTTQFFPNFAFARALRDALGDGGSVFMWSHYERTMLTRIREQMRSRGEEDPELEAWLERLGKRLVDLNKTCVEHYFHPIMGKRTSVKNVLGAVWTIDAEERAAWPQFGAANADPYASLPHAEIAERAEKVKEGTGAVRAYQAMLYGPLRGDARARDAYRDLLLRYCELDTAAMVMIWDHWRRVAGAA